jgi:hypothetical protein
MKLWAYSEIKDKVQKDLGIEQEEFVVASELLGYCNEAIDEAEAEIHSIYEDYFLRSNPINLVAGTNVYSLPTDIYANKIRGIIFKQGNTIYPLRRIRFSDKFEDIKNTETFNTSGAYRYLTINTDATTGVQLQIVPPPRDNVTDGLTIWYLRNANRLAADTDVCDIPEFVHFVMQFMKVRVYEKEGHPNLAVAANQLEQQRRQMVSTLTNMIPDYDNEIEKDLSIYEDMSYGLYSLHY